MGSSLAFGCPECGRKIQLKTRTSGRRVRCARCGTLVEVPFFPRQIGRRRPRRPRWKGWAALGLAAAAAVLLPVAAWRGWRGAIRAGQGEELVRALAELEEAERAGDVASALLAAEQARRLAARSGIAPPGGLAALSARRDELARSDLAARLRRLPALAPAEALEHAGEIAERVGADPALADLAGPAREAVAEAARRRADEVLRRSLDAEGSGDPVGALAMVEGLAAQLDALPTGPTAAARERVRKRAAAVVRAYGVRIDPIASGPATTDEPADDDRPDLLAAIGEGLRHRGYVVMPPGSPRADLWDGAPFRFRASVEEKLGGLYLQSPHRTTQIGLRLELKRDGRTIWEDYFEARTRVPLPHLSAMEASRLILGSRPNPEIERRFARDAWLDLMDKLRLKLGAVPAAPAPPAA